MWRRILNFFRPQKSMMDELAEEKSERLRKFYERYGRMMTSEERENINDEINRELLAGRKAQ